jgi:hypothetical protein
MAKLIIVGFLIAATALEASGDAIVRMGLNQPAPGLRALLFLAGAALLFGYGLMLNLAPLEFGRVVGIYVADALHRVAGDQFHRLSVCAQPSGFGGRDTRCRGGRHRRVLGAPAFPFFMMSN